MQKEKDESLSKINIHGENETSIRKRNRPKKIKRNSSVLVKVLKSEENF